MVIRFAEPNDRQTSVANMARQESDLEFAKSPIEGKI